MRIKIDGIELEVQPGEILLNAARRAGITIPTLCYHEAFGGQGHCRMCLVEVRKGAEVKLVASCTYPINEEVEVKTRTPVVEKIRQNIVMLLCKEAPASEIMQKMYVEYGCEANLLEPNEGERCILCRLCVKACEKMGASAISAVFRGTSKRIGTPYDEPSADCIGCAACAQVCPTGAIEVRETADTRTIWHRDFELVRCKECGRVVGTKEQSDYLRSKLNGITPDYELCDTCRRHRAAKRLKDYGRV